MDKIAIRSGTKNIVLPVKQTGFFSRGTGLMFRTKHTKNLLFDFNRDVRVSMTGIFVFFDFLLVWLNEKNEVLDARVVKPFSVSIKPDFHFRRVVEVPVNEKNRNIIAFFDEKCRKV